MQISVRTRAGLVATLALSLLLLAACGGDERVAENGDRVQVHYTGTLDNGEEFDSSRDRGPLEFVVGAGGVIEGFNAAVIGLAVGDSKTVRIEPAQAYGERDDSRVLRFPREQAPDGLAVGDQVTVGNAPAVVTEMTDTEVVVDANHRLAGEALTFEIELVSIDEE
jgi:FKBP-type peptidyl-prolyl cis-trans isomerase 2